MAEYKIPKRMKYRKQQRGRMSGVATRGAEISFGEYGLKALEPAWITGKQIEASRVAMTRFIKRGGKIWIRIFPDKPITKKPAETRMGKGKGAPEGWVAIQYATRALGVSRQTVLQRVKRGELRAVLTRTGRRKGLRIELPQPQNRLF